MKAATAPTPPSPARSAATSAPRSKSSLLDRDAGGRHAIPSAAGDRREEADLGAVAERRALVARGRWLSALRRTRWRPQRLGMRGRRARSARRAARRLSAPAPTRSPRPDRAPRAPRRSSAPRPSSEQLRRTAGSATVSPGAIACPGGLSTRPSAQTAEVSTPELWLANRSSPPASLRRTRRNSRRRSGLRPVEVGAHRDRPRRQVASRPAGAAAPAARRAGR